MLTQVVLLPTPPFALATANTRWTLMREGGSGGGEKDGGSVDVERAREDAREDAAVGEGWETARAAGHGGEGGALPSDGWFGTSGVVLQKKGL